MAALSIPTSGLIPWLLALLLLYLALMVWLPRSHYKAGASVMQYFLASRKLGTLAIALTFTASWFGATSMKGSLEAYIKDGLSALWMLAIPSLLSTACIALFMAKRVARQPYLSQPEAVASHYGPQARGWMAFVIVAATTNFVAAQSLAAGSVLSSVLGWPLESTIALVMVGVLCYAVLGGYSAVVITDMAQMVFVVLGLLLLLGSGLWQGFHLPDGLFTSFQQLPSSFWNWQTDWPANVALTLSFVLAWIIAPEMWQRMRSAPNERTAQRAAWGATALLCALLASVLLIGLLGAVVLPQAVPQAEGFYALASLLPHPALGALVLLALLAAVTSSMDSSLNVGSLVLSQDLYPNYLRPLFIKDSSHNQANHPSAAELLRVAQWSTIAIAVPAYLIAARFKDIIHVLWLSADIYACAMFWPIMGLLFDRRLATDATSNNSGVFSRSGRWAMVTGSCLALTTALVQYGWVTLPFPYPPNPYSTLLGVALSGLAYWVGRTCDKRQSASDPASSACLVRCNNS